MYSTLHAACTDIFEVGNPCIVDEEEERGELSGDEKEFELDKVRKEGEKEEEAEEGLESIELDVEEVEEIEEEGKKESSSASFSDLTMQR